MFTEILASEAAVPSLTRAAGTGSGAAQAVQREAGQQARPAAIPAVQAAQQSLHLHGEGLSCSAISSPSLTSC